MLAWLLNVLYIVMQYLCLRCICKQQIHQWMHRLTRMVKYCSL